MFKNISKYIKNLAQEGAERKIIQQTYLSLSIGLIVVAGIISLINQDIGHSISVAAAVFFVIFLVNALVWSLVSTSIQNYVIKDEPKSVEKPKKRS